MTDGELLTAYAERGSQAAFAEIVAQHAPRVYATCWRILGDAHAAEDATQAVFLVLARKTRGIGRGAVLAGWLHLAARQSALALRKRELRRERHEQEAAEMREHESTGREISWEEVRPQLDAALGALSGPQRNAVLLRHLYG